MSSFESTTSNNNPNNNQSITNPIEGVVAVRNQLIDILNIISASFENTTTSSSTSSGEIRSIIHDIQTTLNNPDLTSYGSSDQHIVQIQNQIATLFSRADFQAIFQSSPSANPNANVDGHSSGGSAAAAAASTVAAVTPGLSSELLLNLLNQCFQVLLGVSSSQLSCNGLYRLTEVLASTLLLALKDIPASDGSRSSFLAKLNALLPHLLLSTDRNSRREVTYSYIQVLEAIEHLCTMFNLPRSMAPLLFYILLLLGLIDDKYYHIFLMGYSGLLSGYGMYGMTSARRSSSAIPSYYI